MHWLKRVYGKILRIVLFVFFSTYTILLVATSLPYLYAALPPIPWLHARTIRQESPTVYVGTFPDEAMLKALKKQGVTRVVSLIDARWPFLKDFGNYEKKLCKKLGLEYNNYSIFSSTELADFSEFLWVVKGKGRKVFIHKFFDTQRVHDAARFLQKHPDGR